MQLRFDKEGRFKILQLTDLHWRNYDYEDRKTENLIIDLISLENPDLIVITGDIIHGPACVNSKNSIRDVVKIFHDSKIPFAVVFGNHDSEEGLSKQVLLDTMQESSYCLTAEGNTSGVGNYCIHLKDYDDSHVLWNLFFLDSGMTNEDKVVGGYDYIKREQINWYVNYSTNLSEKYNSEKELMFFHIPIPEYKEVWEEKKCNGSKNESICSPQLNSGLFLAMRELQKVKGVFVGHDHVNDFSGELCGVKLCYGRATGYNTYGKKGFMRGGRIINLDKEKRTFETYKILEDGSTVE